MSSTPFSAPSAAAPSSPAETSGPGVWIEARPVRLAELLRGLLEMPARLWRQRELIAAGVRRDLSARLTGTVLGRAWPVVAPLVTFAIYWFLFTRLLGFRMSGLPAGQESAMALWIFTGVLVWSAFAEGLTRAASSLQEGASLLTKLAFPAEILPLQAVLSSSILMLPGLLLFALVCACTPLWIAPGASWLAVPLLLVLQGLFTLGLAWIASAAQVFLRDTVQGLALGLSVLALVTPVFWVPAVEVLPGLGAWLPWIELNPLHHLLVAWRAVLLGGEPAFLFEHQPWRALAIFAPWALCTCALGHVVFQLGSRRFADEV
jgi:lipopolysaccharide transport system permease protein